MQQIFDMAKQYVELGLPIIPLCEHDHKHASKFHVERCKCPGKSPVIKEWQTHNETTIGNLNTWVSSFKGFNIGLPLGDASGYCGIDVDGEEGVKLLMEMSNGDLPATWEFASGAGQRLLYLIPGNIKTKKFKQTGDGKHQECALLCSGQQTVMPPSIHYTGRRYEWVDGHSPWDIDCALAPQWLIDKIRLDETETINLNKLDTSLPNMQMPQPSTGAFSMDDEFVSTDFEATIPEDVKLSNKNIRTGKSGHKIVVTEELLHQMIPEGSRDNTMTAIAGHYCANRDLRMLGKEMILDLCLKHNATYCQPPLDEQVIRDKVDYFFELEQLKTEEYDAKKKKVFESTVMAKNVIQYINNKGMYLEFDQISKMYYYTSDTKGPWIATRNYQLINKWIREVLISPHYGDKTWDKRSYVEETRAALEELSTNAYIQYDAFDLGAHQKELRDYIVVNNGMVDWQNKKLVPWDVKFKTTVSFDVDYDPYATCPKFESYLAQWLPDEDVRKVIQEYLGYCLIPNTNYRKALFLYGKGRNGKSIFIEFLQNFFKSSLANLSYDGLFTRFGPAQLKDKLVNIFDDTNVSFAKETSIAKNLIAGGSISAEFKGRDSFQFQNVARFIYSSQEFPKTSDITGAWYERWFFVEFPNQFKPSNTAKTQIQKDLAEEKSGIFNWMLEGLNRLISQDGFTNSSALAISSQSYQNTNNNVAQFISCFCKQLTKDTGLAKPDERISMKHLYDIYVMWTEEEHQRSVSRREFTKRIEDMNYHIVKGYANKKQGVAYIPELILDTTSSYYDDYKMNISIILTS